MAARFSRLVSAVAAGGVLSGALLFGGGVAAADEGATIPARCGQSVAARNGDTVSVLTPLGTRFPISVGGNSTMIEKTVGGFLCRVGVQVVTPVTRVVPRLVPVVPRYVPVPGTAANDSEPSQSESKGSASPSTAAPSAGGTGAAAPARGPALVPARPVPAQTVTPIAPAAASGAFPSLGQYPLSAFTGGAPGTAAPAGLRNYDAGLLFGSAFPGLRPGAPAYLGYDPASAVTTASQVQALPVDGLSAGLGVPVMLAVLAFAGVAALIVRRGVLGRVRRDATAATATDATAATAAVAPFRTPDVTDDAVFQDGPPRA